MILLKEIKADISCNLTLPLTLLPLREPLSFELFLLFEKLFLRWNLQTASAIERFFRIKKYPKELYSIVEKWLSD